MPTAAIITLGCRLNQAESALIHERLAAAGYNMLPARENVDLGIINTCTVTGEADAKCRKAIRAFVRSHPAAFLAVLGCMSQLHAQEIARIPGVDLVIGNADKLDILKYVASHKLPSPMIIANGIPGDDFIIKEAPKAPPAAKPLTRRTNLKIQEGCDCFCSYCIVPYARGNPRSRSLDNLLDEARALVRRGVKEIILTGINVGAYAFNSNSILDVVDHLTAIIGPAAGRVRISSIELSTIPGGLLERMADPTHALVPFLHVPLQSGCGNTLAAMRRTYTAPQFREFIDQARDTVPDVCIGTDVMVGFPGETDDDFEESCRFVAQGPIDYAHVFKFSPRPGTPAADMPGHVAPNVQNARSIRMRQISDAKRQAFHGRNIGRTWTVLFETCAGGNWYGYTQNYIRVAVPSSLDLENTLAPVKLHQTHKDFMIGSLVNEEQR